MAAGAAMFINHSLLYTGWVGKMRLETNRLYCPVPFVGCSGNHSERNETSILLCLNEWLWVQQALNQDQFYCYRFYGIWRSYDADFN